MKRLLLLAPMLATLLGTVPGFAGYASAEEVDFSRYLIASDVAQNPPQLAGNLEPTTGFYGNYLSALIAEQRKDFDQAIEFLTPVVEGAPDNLDLVSILHSFLAAEGRLDEALPYAEALLADDPTSPFATRTLFYTALKAENFDSAVGFAQNLDGSGIGGFIKPLAEAWSLLGHGQIDEAMAAIEPINEAMGASSFGLTNQALMYWVAGLKDQSLETFSEAIEASGRNVNSRLATLALHALALHGEPEAFDALLAQLRKSGATPRSMVDLLDKINAGTTPAFEITSPAIGMAEAVENIASSFSQDDFAADLSLGLANVALYLMPGNNSALQVKGDLLVDRGLGEQALSAFEAIDGSASEEYTATYARAQALIDLELLEEAQKVLEDLAQTNTERWAALELLANLLRSEDKFEEAIEVYKRAEERFVAAGGPSRAQWRFYYTYAIAHDQLDQWTEAEALFKKSLELKPDEANVMNYLAYSWVDRGYEEHYQRALTMLEEAVELSPNSGFIVDSLAWVQFKLGMYEDALKNMEIAVELMPADPILNDHLGDVYWKNGREQEAIFQWKRAISFYDADDEDLDRVNRKLEVGLDQVEAEEAAAKAAEAEDAEEAQDTSSN